jgi:predicted nucleic acid-binding protein
MRAEEVRRALDLIEARRMSWWDALLLASAIGAGCTHFLTEDTLGAPTIEGVAIIDPFAVTPEDALGV